MRDSHASPLPVATRTPEGIRRQFVTEAGLVESLPVVFMPTSTDHTRPMEINSIPRRSFLTLLHYVTHLFVREKSSYCNRGLLSNFPVARFTPCDCRAAYLQAISKLGLCESELLSYRGIFGAIHYTSSAPTSKYSPRAAAKPSRNAHISFTSSSQCIARLLISVAIKI